LLLCAPEIIVVDHQAALRWPAERFGAIGELVLTQTAFWMMLDLHRRRLPHVHHCDPVEVTGLDGGWVHSSLPDRSGAAGTPTGRSNTAGQAVEVASRSDEEHEPTRSGWA
jgi:hypothetical protein